MTKKDIRNYKDKINLEKGFNAYWNRGFDEAIALVYKETELAINYSQCCVNQPSRKSKAFTDTEIRKHAFNTEVEQFFCEDCQKWVEEKCDCGNTDLSLDYTE